MNMNTIYLRRCRKVWIRQGDDVLSVPHIATVQKNLEAYGFVLSETLTRRVQSLSLDRLRTFYRELVKDIQEMVGAHRVFRPMYPDFPKQVMRASEATLYWNALIHYWSNRLPNVPSEDRPPLADRPNLRTIDLGTKEDFEAIFTRLAGSPSSLSPTDKADVAWFVAQYRDDIARIFPPTMPFKENMAYVGAQLLRNTSIADVLLDGKIKTATDVLRLAVALSDGDVSLAEPTKFTKFPRRQRQQLLAWLERSGNPTEDMLRWSERWKRLGERLHPGEFAERFPKTAAAFSVIRNDRPFETFHRSLERLVLESGSKRATDLLQSRPGELARRLDHLFRLGGDSQYVVQAFRHNASDVSTAVLLQVLTHFRHRVQSKPLRTFFPKGDVAKVYATPDQLPALPPDIPDQIATICEQTLAERFAARPALGKCYVDPALTTFLVPFSQRSASKALRTLVRGSRLHMPDARVLRFFLWWKNGRSRTDIDLSAALFGPDYNYVDVISYYNLKNFGGCHSGDIVDAPNGAAEFIDLDIRKTHAGKVRFIVMSINSFTTQPYCDLPECFAGWMGRNAAGSGEIFEPRTVEDKVDLASNTQTCLPAIFDLEKREVIWADIALGGRPRWNNVRNNLTGVSLMLRALTNLVKTDLYTLFSLHVAARGSLVLEPDQADTVFSVHRGITPFDQDRIAAEFL